MKFTVVPPRKGRVYGLGSCASSASPEYTLRRPTQTIQTQTSTELEELLRESRAGDERHIQELKRVQQVVEEMRRAQEEAEEARRRDLERAEEARRRDFARLEDLIIMSRSSGPAGTPLAGLQREAQIPPYGPGSASRSLGRGGRGGSRGGDTV